MLTNTVTASEVVAQETVTLTMSASGGLVSTYTMTVSQATTVTGKAAQPTVTQRPTGGLGYVPGGGQQCGAAATSTVTLISVSTLCATGSVCAAQATGL